MGQRPPEWQGDPVFSTEVHMRRSGSQGRDTSGPDQPRARADANTNLMGGRGEVLQRVWNRQVFSE